MSKKISFSVLLSPEEHRDLYRLSKREQRRPGDWLRYLLYKKRLEEGLIFEEEGAGVSQRPQAEQAQEKV